MRVVRTGAEADPSGDVLLRRRIDDFDFAVFPRTAQCLSVRGIVVVLNRRWRGHLRLACKEL